MKQNVLIDLNAFKEALTTVPDAPALLLQIDEIIGIIDLPLSEILKCKSMDDLNDIIDKLHELEEEESNRHESIQFIKQLNEIMFDSEAYSISFTGVF